MELHPSKKPWILMTAEAASGRKDRVAKLGEFYDVIIVPAEYFQQAVELLDNLSEKQDGQQNQVLRDAGPSDGNH